MKTYASPVLKIVAFTSEEVITASAELTKISGGGDGVVLPDDKWSEE